MSKVRYTQAVINKLSKDPNIKEILPNRLRFTLEFRQKVYDAINPDFTMTDVRRYLTDAGYDCHMLGCGPIEKLSHNFKEYGRPVNGGINTSQYHPDKSDNEKLLKSGKFRKAHNGITFTDEFINELYQAYPEQSIEDGIRAAGIDPDMVGYQRINTLQRRFEGKESTSRDNCYTDSLISKYKNHPYVERGTRKQFVLKASFYNETSHLVGMKIDDLLDLYELDHTDLPISFRIRLKYKIEHWKQTEDRQTEVSEQVIQIQESRMRALQKLLADRLAKDGKNFHSMCWADKQELCRKLSSMPEDPERFYTASWYLKQTGVPRTTYYEILRNEDYGTFRSKKDKQDKKDIKTIRKVIDYEGFGKGARQVYMDMNDITGKQFCLKKIYRLMHKFGIQTSIRRKNASRQAAQALLKRNVKANLVKRRFKLFEPNQVRLTDVTYLDYGNGKRAYCSASKDPVTNKLIDLTVSSSNNIDLAMATLSHIAEQPMTENPILHSDQGVLYLTDTFQNKVKKLGMRQSMSKRGNCWDNAPQESFFGHFKDEVNYRQCETLEELKQICSAYFSYYNNERHQWNLNKMTPVQYEKYLLNMTAEQKAKRTMDEEKKYSAMKERAAAEAKARAATLGV